MKYDPEKSFGYPVLCRDMDDYLKAAFQASFSFDLDDDNVSKFKLKYAFTCSVKEIRELISADKAAYWVKVSCRSTFYSKLHEVPAHGELSIDGALLRNTVDFSGYVIAKKEAELTSSKINPEFGYETFTVSNGQVLALERPTTYVTDKDFWKPISSIFEYRQDDDLKNGEFTVDIEDEFIQIFSNSVQLQKFKQFGRSTNGRITLLSTVFLSALSQMIEAMIHKPDEYADKKWARILEAKAASKRIDLYDRRPFVAAQRLLDRPLGKLADAFLEK
jgi:hypothetical protein